jgi:hypothetical protein
MNDFIMYTFACVLIYAGIKALLISEEIHEEERASKYDDTL